MVAVFGAALFPAAHGLEGAEFTLRWKDAAEIDWVTIVLFGSGIIFVSLTGRPASPRPSARRSTTRWA